MSSFARETFSTSEETRAAAQLPARLQARCRAISLTACRVGGFFVHPMRVAFLLAFDIAHMQRVIAGTWSGLVVLCGRHIVKKTTRATG